MNQGFFRNAIFISMVCIGSLLLSSHQPQLFAAQEPAAPPDILIKISHLDKSLEVIDALAAAAGPESGISPGAMVKGMLQGTDWIDFSRPMVIGVEIKDPKPETALFIPFKKPNPAFQTAYQAVQGPGYYFLSLPPGAGKPDKALEPALEKASRPGPDASASVEVAVDALLKKADPKIQEALSALQSLPPGKTPPDLPLSPAQLRETAEKVLKTARQLKTLDLRFHLTPDEIAYEAALLAHAGSEMADIFTQSKAVSRLSGFHSGLQMNFRSRAFQTEKLLSLLGETFGTFYQSVGIDFSKLMEISAYFTGEMAGGMALEEKGIVLEMIHVLKGEKHTEGFIGKTYLPWLEDFGKTLQQSLEKQLKDSVDPVFSRTPDSKVAGRPVYGIQFRFPAPSVTPPADPGLKLFNSLGLYAFRMTVVDDLLLSASTDERLARLIQKADKLKAAPAKGPLMTFEYDLAAYLGSLKKMLPGLPQADQPLPRLGKVSMMLDLGNGRASVKSAVKTADIRSLIAHFAGAPPAGILAEKKESARPDPEKGKGGSPDPKASKLPGAEASDRMKQGTLAALNGDNASAVAHYRKAIEIEPDFSDAHFHLGVALGEMGAYPEAVAALNRAVVLNPQSGAYLYGRGRIYLLSGEREKALADFKRAAELKDPDARSFLKKAGSASKN